MAQWNSQRGAALITSLVLLVIMTVLSMSAMRNTLLEERMAGNVRSENIAFQAAEAALRAGEETLKAWEVSAAGPPAATSDGNSGVWTHYSPDPDTSNSQVWWREWKKTDWEADGTAISTSLEWNTGKTLTDVPRFVIEELQYVKQTSGAGLQQDFSTGGWQFYQVTARGVDMSGRAEVLLRSTLAIAVNN